MKIAEAWKTNLSQVERRKKYIFVLLAVTCFMLTAIGSSALSASAAPTPPGTIKTWYTEPDNKIYKKFHVNVPGLPIGFRETDESLHLYHTIEADGKRFVYCIEVQNHVFPNTPLPSDTPGRKLNAEQQKLLEYVLAQGPEFLNTSDDSAVKSYSAAQIVAWLITEDVYKDTKVLDAALFPATGDHSDTEGFAQTLEIGRLGRSYLNHAWAQLNGTTLKLQPSFTSTDPSTAPTHTMTADGSGSYAVSLPDTASPLGENWFAGRLMVSDAAGLNISVKGNTMTVTGTPMGGAIIELVATVPVGKLQYLQEDDMQAVARYLFTRFDKQKFYFKVDAGTVPTPTVSTPTVPTPTVSTPTVPTPTVPTPTVPTPTVSTPTVPTPTVSTPTVPTPTMSTPPTPNMPQPPTNHPKVTTGGSVLGANGSIPAGIALLLGGSGLLIALIYWLRKYLLSR